jgi:alpha-galactosidase
MTIKAQKFENLASTPPMGWNSWNHFTCNVSEKLIKEIADSMVSSGMKDAGYVYINIDDCWHGKRDSSGFIHPDSERFPSGIKELADYIHSKGLKIGLYSCAGSKTCAGYRGSRGHEYQDALSYASWGIDYFKYDWCNTENLNAIGAYTTMRDALYSAGRPIIFSICEWGNNKPWEWGPEVGHLWRTTGDIYNCFDCIKDHGKWKSYGVMQILDMQDGLRKYAGPHHWNDPDMLEVGNGLTENENRAHFSMWCMIAAPLIAGNDVRNLPEDVKYVLTNKDVIAIDQDKFGVQGFKYSSKDSLEVWFKPLANDNWAMSILNRSTKPKTISFDWNKENVFDDLTNRATNFNTTEYQLKDLWKKENIGTTKNVLTATIPGHDVLLLTLIKIKD